MWLLITGPSDAGDEDAVRFASAYKRYQALAIKIAYELIHDLDTAQDIAANVFVYVLEHRKRIFERCPTDGHVKNYIVAATKNDVRDYLKHSDFIDPSTIEDSDAELDIKDPQITSEQIALAKKIVASLSPDEKHLVLLKVIYEEKPLEIAQSMHKSEAAIYKGWQRTRRKVQILLDQQNIDIRDYI